MGGVAGGDEVGVEKVEDDDVDQRKNNQVSRTSKIKIKDQKSDLKVSDFISFFYMLNKFRSF